MNPTFTRGAQALGLAASLAFSAAAQAGAVESLRDFARDVKGARAEFSQTVTSPDGSKKRTSQGSFEFQRPDRFRFDYAKPYKQQIVSDGKRVWLFDQDLNQVSTRSVDQAIGSTPAVLLAGGPIDRDFTVKAVPDKDGLQWAEATPRAKDGQFQLVRVGFRGKTLATLEILDSFGQRSRLEFTKFEANPSIPAQRFEFKPPAGADVIEN